MKTSKNVKNTVRRIARRLDKTIYLHETACGHEENIIEAMASRDKLLKLIEIELHAMEGGRYEIHPK